jgi:hypothetical protein
MSYTKRRAVMIQNILYYFFYCDSVIVYLGVVQEYEGIL